MKTFYKILAGTLLVATTNNFVWFALTFWAFLETKSVIATSFVGGFFLVATALSGFWLGSLVDHHKKKVVMLGSSATSLLFYILGFLLYLFAPVGAFTSVASPYLWLLIVLLLSGTISGNIYGIAIPTLVTLLVPEDRRDRANGLSGTVMGTSFAITSVFSGLVLAFGGMYWVLVASIVTTIIAIIYFAYLPIPEKHIAHTGDHKPKKIDIKGTIAAIRGVPGLMQLIFFNTFNNFLGGVFMALMDAYGLTLVSVQVWGLLWGFLSFGFILGGLYIAKKGLSEDPVRQLFLINIVLWTICIFFTVQSSIVLLTVGMLIYMILVPFCEAIEQTILQKVVPPERQGRVFGFSQSVEQAASPLTAFIIGPIAQLVFIPFMTTGAGVELLGSWFGTGMGRGLALVFIFTGLIGLIVTLIAMRSRAYKLLTAKYQE